MYVAVVLSDCQSGWTRSGFSCYKRFSSRKTWDSAESDCNQRGGHLVSIVSASENSIVHNLRGTSWWSSDIWIGFNDKENEGSFAWIDGTNISYTNWDTSRDNGDCVRMLSDGTCMERETVFQPTSIRVRASPHLTTSGASVTVQSTTTSSSIVTTCCFRGKQKI